MRGSAGTPPGCGIFFGRGRGVRAPASLDASLMAATPGGVLKDSARQRKEQIEALLDATLPLQLRSAGPLRLIVIELNYGALLAAAPAKDGGILLPLHSEIGHAVRKAFEFH